ncbi:mitotic interactor and substrate of PLK1 [Rhineura floridana]|uniref:mitotic interactor and substrate of PLK1 n=1 Tax=Rhineura floridana TaxID=261503 RepID=UPI002AC88933|nr:mitotic interactor and substrate of PLK1 [Rhineura floridana]
MARRMWLSLYMLSASKCRWAGHHGTRDAEQGNEVVQFNSSSPQWSLAISHPAFGMSQAAVLKGDELESAEIESVVPAAEAQTSSAGLEELLGQGPGAGPDRLLTPDLFVDCLDLASCLDPFVAEDSTWLDFDFGPALVLLPRSHDSSGGICYLPVTGPTEEPARKATRPERSGTDLPPSQSNNPVAAHETVFSWIENEKPERRGLSQNRAPDLKASQGHWRIQALPAPEEHLKTQGEVPEASLPKMEPDPMTLVFSASQNAVSEYEEQNGQQAGSRGETRFEDTDDEYFDLGHRDQKAGNGWRLMEPPEDGSRWESKSINGRKDLWALPPDRESKLEVVKSGSLYNIRAYTGEKKKPSRLYDEDEEEMRYKIPPEDVSSEKAKELKKERQEIIRGQVVRKSTTVVERWSSVNELEATTAASPGKDFAEGRRSYSTGFAICFDGPSSSWVSTPVNPQNIDTEQINFAAARQQFLELEQTNPKVLLGVRKPTTVTTPRSQIAQNIHGREEHAGPGDSEYDCQRRPRVSHELADLLISQGTEPTSSGQAAICQNSTGDVLYSNQVETPHDLSAMTPVGKVSTKKAGEHLDWVASGQDPAKEPGASDETPIEREIRLSMEREKDHWKERGIQRVSSRDELVEIRSKSLLSSAIAWPASSRKGKDKPRVSFYVQREIEQETKREADLQKEGRLLGMYDKGVHQELAERRKVFERDEAAPMISPHKARKEGQLREVSDSKSAQAHCSFATDTETGKTIADPGMTWTSEAYRLSSPNPNTGKRRPENELTLLNHSFSNPNQQMDSPRPRLSGSQGPESPGEEPVLLRGEHFAIPVQKLRFSAPDDQGLQIARKKEDQPERSVSRDELYTLKTWRPRTSALIDQEIQDALQREVELQEQRRKARLTTEREPHSRSSSQSSAASGIADRYSVTALSILVPDSPARLSPQQVYLGILPSEPDLTMPHQSVAQPSVEEKKRRAREEGKYAGIELSDEIDTEVVKSTKVIRQRGVLAELWETGQIRRIRDDGD